MNTCQCDINCPTWGPFCDRCAKGVGGQECSGKGGCSEQGGQCQCDASLWHGKACENQMVTSTCSVHEYVDVTTFDGSYVASWKGRGEMNLLLRTLRDGTTEKINVLIGSGRSPLSGVTGLSIQSTQTVQGTGTASTTVSVVGEEQKNAVTMMTTTGIVVVDKTVYPLSEQANGFHVQSGELCNPKNGKTHIL